jgi:hypothetical protein
MFHQPCYVSYHPSITLVHGEGIAVPTYAKDNFALTAEALRAAWQPGAKILMLNSAVQSDGRHLRPRAVGADRRVLPREGSAGAERRDLLRTHVRRHAHEHREPAGHGRAHDFPARIFQGLCDDRLAHRLRLRPGGADRRNDEGAPIRDDVCLDHRPGASARGAETRLGQRAKDARAISPPPRPDRAPIQRNRPEVSLAARDHSTRFPTSQPTGLTEKEFASGLLEHPKGRGGAGHAFGDNGIAATSAPVSPPPTTKSSKPAIALSGSSNVASRGETRGESRMGNSPSGSSFSSRLPPQLQSQGFSLSPLAHRL